MSVLLRFFSRVDSAFSETSKTFGILPISRSLLRENGYHRDMREPLSGAGASRCQVLARERARTAAERWLGSEPSPAASDRRARARELSS